MTDQNQTDAPQDENGNSNPAKPKKRRFKFIIAGLVAAVIGVAGVGAVAMHKHHAMWHDSERFSEFVDHKLDKILDRLDATEQQKAKMKPILQEASKDVRKMAFEMRNSRDAYMVALLGNTVDRQTVETLRAEQVKAMDQASERVAKALTDAAEILTPEQRAKIAKKLERHRHD